MVVRAVVLSSRGYKFAGSIPPVFISIDYLDKISHSEMSLSTQQGWVPGVQSILALSFDTQERSHSPQGRLIAQRMRAKHQGINVKSGDYNHKT